MNTPKKSIDFSFQLKNLHLFFGLILLFYIIYLGQRIILPFVFSGILAIVLSSPVNYLVKRNWNRIIAISFVLAVAVVLMAAVIFFIFSQMSMFGEALPALREKFHLLLKDSVKWCSEALHTPAYKLNTWVDKQTKDGMSSYSSTMISQTVARMIRIMVNMLLIPVYVFLLLVYKELILTFMSRVFPNDRHETVVEVLNESKMLIQSYLLGLMIEAAIVAAMNSTALLLIGIDYAIMLGIICALLNLIPYIGGIVGALLTTVFALVTVSPFAAVMALVAYLFVQLIDNNFIVPYVVGSKVKINALASILVVMIGGEMYGVPGMFLAIPLTAIIKVICDRIDRLKPLGMLMGDTMPTITKSIFNVKPHPVLKKKVEHPKEPRPPRPHK